MNSQTIAKKSRKAPSSLRGRITLVVFFTLFTMLLSIGFPTWGGVSGRGWLTVTNDSWSSKICFIGVLLLLPLVTITTVIACITAPFAIQVTWSQKIMLVIAGYLGMIFCYSGVYFCINGVGDYNQAISANLAFEYIPKYPGSAGWGDLSREDVLQKAPDIREFKGIGGPLFLAIPEDLTGDTLGKRRYLTGGQIIDLALKPEEHEPRLNQAAAFGIWMDCLHFSIVTAATVGYGDIIPASRFSKLIVDTEILASVAIIVFGFAFVMSERPKE